MDEMKLFYNEETGLWEALWEAMEEPFVTIEVKTEEDYEFLKEAVSEATPAKPTFITITGWFCECGNLVDIDDCYCNKCGQKLDWDEQKVNWDKEEAK